MKETLFDSELKLMELVWERAPISAKQLSLIAAESIGWNKNTTYTVLNKLVSKGFIRRDEPGFICTALVSRSDIRKKETGNLINRLFGGSKRALFSALIEDEQLTEEELAALRRLIDEG